MSYAKRPSTDPNIAEIAALLADPARATMLFSLLDGRPLPATELAYRSGVSPQSASGNLKRLVGGGLVTANAVGRQRLFGIASSDVGHAVEALAAIARPTPIVALQQSTTLERLQAARSCYDHLAGQLGVAVTDRFIAQGALRLSIGTFAVTNRGESFFKKLGVDLNEARATSRSFARSCIDWTERRPHLAGSLGAGVLQTFLAHGWVVRTPQDRALRVTPKGRSALQRYFKLRL